MKSTSRDQRVGHCRVKMGGGRQKQFKKWEGPKVLKGDRILRGRKLKVSDGEAMQGGWNFGEKKLEDANMIKYVIPTSRK